MEKIAFLIVPALIITGFVIAEIEKYRGKGGLQ
jgi:hypothetical protein